MGVLNILRKVFSNNKKVVICGLDNAGKSTIVSFLQKGTFIEHTPTMGKEQSTLEVQDVKINLVDMGGQKDFRSLWVGELKDAECVIFMVDASASERFKEAKAELAKLTSVIKNKPLIVLANKCELEGVASVKDIIEALELMKFPSFEMLPISCKTGYGIVNAFSKIYYRLTGNYLSKKISPKGLTIFDEGGIPLSMAENKDNDDLNQEILRGGLFAAITSFVRESYKSELSQLKLQDHIILFQKSKHLMGSIILNDNDQIDVKEAELGLRELLIHLENMCPELEAKRLNPEKIDYLVKQFATNIFA